ncbi:hypothetical protein BC826DRAFT_69844 [Russula brevipes]|nr:hypothetical protein BC826DRAFT_69844 [Russula brevipes]
MPIANAHKIRNCPCSSTSTSDVQCVPQKHDKRGRRSADLQKNHWRNWGGSLRDPTSVNRQAQGSEMCGARLEMVRYPSTKSKKKKGWWRCPLRNQDSRVLTRRTGSLRERDLPSVHGSRNECRVGGAGSISTRQSRRA